MGVEEEGEGAFKCFHLPWQKSGVAVPLGGGREGVTIRGEERECERERFQEFINLLSFNR